MKNSPIATREEWLNIAAKRILDQVIVPVWDVPKKMKIKVSVGFPPNARTNSRTIGVCLASACSKEGFSEIFISPVADNSLHVLGILAHELAHAVDDCKHGHKGPFVSLIRKMGLIGKPTEALPGPALNKQLKRYIREFGDIPHARVDTSICPPRRDVNRNVKVHCPKCSFKFNTSRAQIRFVIERAGSVTCPACNNAMNYPELTAD